MGSMRALSENRLLILTSPKHYENIFSGRSSGLSTQNYFKGKYSSTYYSRMEDGLLNDIYDNADVMESLPLGKIERRVTKRQECMRSNKRLRHVTTEYTKIWNDYEKQVLYNLLLEHGDEDLHLLAASLPNKHVSQIQTYLRTISRRAFINEKSRKKKEEIRRLDEWINFFKVNLEDEPVDDSVPFELFALAQEFGEQKNPNGLVDFQKACEYLLALMLGRKIDVNEETCYFVHSYLDWFLNQFEKHLLADGVALLSSALKNVTGGSVNSPITPYQILFIIFHKILPQEQYLTNKHLLRSICRKIRNVNFKKGDEFDRKVSLLRAEADEELPLRNVYLNPPSCSIIPVCDKVKFNNLPSFVLSALFNVPVADLIKIASDKDSKCT